MIKECIEHYANGLAAGNDAEDIEGHRNVEGCGTGEANCEGAEDGKDERCQDLERNFKKCVRQEECGEGVCTILVLVVEDL